MKACLPSKPMYCSREYQASTRPRTVQISVPSKLVKDLLAKGAILQVQISPVPLRLDLTRPAPRPEKPESTNPRPGAETSNIRPNADESSRPNPSGSGRSETDITRPERPLSRHQPMRPVSPFTDWSSMSNNDDVISAHSDGSDANYVPRSPVYESESPGPQERDNSRNRASDMDSNERLRPPLGRGTLFQRVSPFLRGIGLRRRYDLGRIRPM